MLAVAVYDMKYVKFIRFRVITVQAAVGRQPYVMVAVFADIADTVVRQRPRRVGMPEPARRAAVGQSDYTIRAS